MGSAIYVSFKPLMMVLITATHTGWETESFIVLICHLDLGNLHLVFPTTTALTPQLREPT